MTQGTVSVIRTGRSSRRTCFTRPAVLTLAALALVVGGCSSGPAEHNKAEKNKDATGAGGSSTPPIKVTRVHRLPQGVIASIHAPVGTTPMAATPGFGSLWVVGHDGPFVLRVNPHTNKVVAKISVGGSCFSPTVTATRVVIGTCDEGNLVIDPRTNRVVGAAGHVPMGGPPPRALQFNAMGVQSAFAYVNGVPWGWGPGRCAPGCPPDQHGLEALDPRTFRPTGPAYPVNANPRHVTDPDPIFTYADGFWWGINFGDEDFLWGGQVVKIDPRTGSQTHFKVPSPGLGPDLETLGHAIWMKSISNNKLVRMDTRTGHLTTYHLPGWKSLYSFYPQVIVVARGDLWIRVRSGRIVRFDPRKKRVVATYPGDPGAAGGYETVAFGSLWVMNYNTDTVWRVRLTS